MEPVQRNDDSRTSRHHMEVIHENETRLYFRLEDLLEDERVPNGDTKDTGSTTMRKLKQDGIRSPHIAGCWAPMTHEPAKSQALLRLSKASSGSSLRSTNSNSSKASSTFAHSTGAVMRLSASTGKYSWQTASTLSTIGSIASSEQPYHGSNRYDGSGRKASEKIWDMIVDESGVDHVVSLKSLPPFSFLSVQNRPCCEPREHPTTSNTKLPHPTCDVCGSTFGHRAALHQCTEVFKSEHGDHQGFSLADIMKERDKFGNTPLHFAAGSGYRSLLSPTSLKRIPIHDILAKNSSGETFMHLLDPIVFWACKKATIADEYLDLLRYLKSIGFPLSHPDCHGRTIAHLHSHSLRITYVHGGGWAMVAKVVRCLDTDLNTLNNFGYSVSRQMGLLRRCGSDVVKTILSIYSKPASSNISFRHEIFSSAWVADTWTERLRINNLVNWIDKNGDTPLSAILKKWKGKGDELQFDKIIKELVQLGADVNIRGQTRLNPTGHCDNPRPKTMR